MAETQIHNPADNTGHGCPTVQMPMLNQFAQNLVQQAREGKISSCIGRDKELFRLETILGKQKKRNPILIGDPGVGKTAIADQHIGS